VKNSPISITSKDGGEHKSKKVTGLASSRQNLAHSWRTISRTIRATDNARA
jgi:hypothetical protein